MVAVAPDAANQDMTSRSIVLMILGPALLAAAIRVVGIRWDQPFYLHPDEGFVTNPASLLLKTGRLKARSDQGKPNYVYPPLLAEIIALECLAYYPFSSWPSLKHIPKASVRMAGRASTTVAAAVTVSLLGWLALRLTGSLAVGALAGTVLALSPLHAESSRYATTDVLTGLWVLLAAWAGARIVEQGRWRDYVLGAVAVGAAAATKYPAGIACVLIAVAHFARPAVFAAPREHKKLVAAALCTLAAMVVILPPGVVDWKALYGGAQFQISVYGRGHGGFQSPHPAWDGVRTLWTVGLGECAMVAGMLWLRGPTSRRRLLPLIALCAAYLLLLGAQGMFMARNLIHFLPATILLCSWGFARALDGARRLGSFSVALLALGLVLPSAARAAAQVRALYPRDTRLLARDWVAEHLKPGTRVVVTNGGHPYSVAPLQDLGLKLHLSGRPDLDALHKKGFRWVVHSDGVDVRFLRTPERFPDEVEAIRTWTEGLERRGKLEKHFPRRPLPGGDLPGSTAPMYHQPDVKIFRIDGPRPR